MAAPRLLYLHGFCSSPASWKARLLHEHLAAIGQAEAFVCPFLPPVPRRAIAEAEALLAEDVPTTLVGSSLGAYYATWLAEKYALRAVLINPAVSAPVLLGGLVGRHVNFHTGEPFEFTREHAEQLAAFAVPRVSPARYLLLVETGDEVLDYRQAVERYAGCRQVVVDGGEHGLRSFPEHLPQLFEFCGL